MKIAVLSDAHGNSPALKECLDYITSVYNADKIFFLGDAIGYLPDFPGVIDLLISHKVNALLGNHEAMFLGKIPLDKKNDEVYGIEKNGRNLTEEHISFIKGLLPFQEQSFRQRILFSHGDPCNPLIGYVYPDTEISNFEFLPFDIVFMGHTHRPFIRKIKNKMVVNVGSCGLPRDEGSLFSFAVYDSETGEVEILRVFIDPGKLISSFGKENIHPSTIGCLMRKSDKPVIGRIL